MTALDELNERARQEWARAEAAEARIAQLEAALIKFGSGWNTEFQTGKAFCNYCGNERSEGHADDCPFEVAKEVMRQK